VIRGSPGPRLRVMQGRSSRGEHTHLCQWSIGPLAIGWELPELQWAKQKNRLPGFGLILTNLRESLYRRSPHILRQKLLVLGESPPPPTPPRCTLKAHTLTHSCPSSVVKSFLAKLRHREAHRRMTKCRWSWGRPALRRRSCAQSLCTLRRRSDVPVKPISAITWHHRGECVPSLHYIEPDN
jgi:hypothetical protein